MALWEEAAWPVRMPADPELTAKGAKVYQEFVLPLQPYLSGATRLVIVRAFIGGAYPFELMVDPAGSFLGQQFEVSYTPSATLYVWMREHARPRQDPRTWQVLAVGDRP